MDRCPTIRFALLAVVLSLAACHKPEQQQAKAGSAATADAEPTSQASALPGPLLPLAASPDSKKAGGGDATGLDPAPVRAAGTEANPPDTVPTPAPAALDQPRAQPIAPARVPTADPVVLLVKAGAAPHRKLRLVAAKGQKERMKMVMEMDIDVKLGVRSPPKTQLPPMVMFLAMTVGDTRPNGDIGYRFLLDDADIQQRPGVQPNVAKQLGLAMSKMKGMSGRAVVSNRGFNREASLELPPGADPKTQQIMAGMEQAMQQLSAPLPQEAVGVGAQWTLTQELQQNGITMQQVATYDLTAISGNTMSADVTVTQSAAPQTMAVPGGGTMKLLSLDSKGAGTMKIDLTKLTPQISKMDLTSKVQMEIPQPQQPQQMEMSTHIIIDISPR